MAFFIHKEGRKIIFTTILCLLIVNIILLNFVGVNLWTKIFSVFSVLLSIFIIAFFRITRRKYEELNPNAIIAPADGKIVVIEKVFEHDFFQDDRIQISIFMSVTNAHTNFYPVSGEVVHMSHEDGRFRSAYLPKSSVENERSNVLIETKSKEKVLVRQIAGALARRIVTYAKKGEKCRAGEQLGFIKFGSRVDLFLPIDTEIFVEMGEKVKANSTIIGVLKGAENFSSEK